MIAFANPAATAETLTIAVFTKNTTNPAYEAFRIGADQVGRALGARIIHYVPKKPDDVDEQKAFVAHVLSLRPDAVVFIPVDDVAMVDSVRMLNDAKIPVVLASNPLPGRFVTYVGADDVEIGYRQARYLFEYLGAKGQIVVIEGTAAAPTNRDRLRGYQQAMGTGIGSGLEAWQPGPFKVLPHMKQLTLDLATDVFMGVELDRKEADRINRAFVDAVRAGLAPDGLPAPVWLFWLRSGKDNFA